MICIVIVNFLAVLLLYVNMIEISISTFIVLCFLIIHGQCQVDPPVVMQGSVAHPQKHYHITVPPCMHGVFKDIQKNIGRYGQALSALSSKCKKFIVTP
jgi:hypothetical protein